MGPHAPQKAIILWRMGPHAPQNCDFLWRMWPHAAQKGHPPNHWWRGHHISMAHGLRCATEIWLSVAHLSPCATESHISVAHSVPVRHRILEFCGACKTMRHKNIFCGAWQFGAPQNVVPPIASFLVVNYSINSQVSGH